MQHVEQHRRQRQHHHHDDEHDADRDGQVGVLEHPADHPVLRSRALSDCDGHSDHAHDSLRREVRYT